MKKRNLKVCTLFIFLLGFFFFPKVANAKNYSSDFILIDSPSFSYSDEELSLSQVFFSKSISQNGETNSYGNLYGKMENLNKYSLFVYMTVEYYDINYEIIARSTKTETPRMNQNNYFINIILYDKDFLGNSTIDDVAYFKINYYTVQGITLQDTNRNEVFNTDESSLPSISQNNNYKAYSYVIDKYDVNIVVNENNTLDITENITAYFNSPKHGIYRTIPVKNEITRLDGTTSKNRVQISNVNVNYEYKTFKEKGNYKIQIGSSDYTLTGTQNYVIQYTYNLGKDPLKEIDELYYNIIGTDWDTVIGNLTFTIVMPKEFDASKLGFSSGDLGSTQNKNVQYVVKENTIVGSYNGILASGQALTVRCELPEGYFVGAGLKIDFTTYIFFFPFLLSLICLIFWYFYEKREFVVESVEFYPPNGLNSLEIGFLYRGEARQKDVTSLLIYLASKGYIKITDEKEKFSKVVLDENKQIKVSEKINALQLQIEEEEKKSNPNLQKIKILKHSLENYKNIDKPIDYNSLGIKDIKEKAPKIQFIKLKEYEEENKIEKKFMQGIFGFFNTNYSKEEVKLEDLKDNFYLTTNQILRLVNSNENKSKIFNPKNNIFKVFVFLLFLLIVGTALYLIFNQYVEKNISLAIFIFSIFILIGSITKNKGQVYFLIFFSFIFLVFLVMSSSIKDFFIFNPLMSICFFLNIVGGFLTTFVYFHIRRRNAYGLEMLGKIRGFKNFLETVEKDKLEAMVLENPTYFYDILPFSYVLDISDKWISKFESLHLKTPDWYESSTSFDSFIHSVMPTIHDELKDKTSNTDNNSSSSSSDSSTGGGVSGGGSGGGGGGSW